MTMIPTPTGYDLIQDPAGYWRSVDSPARHRAVMTAETSHLNREAKAGRWLRLHGAHWAPLTGAAAWLAEEAAQIREIIRGGR